MGVVTGNICRSGGDVSGDVPGDIRMGGEARSGKPLNCGCIVCIACIPIVVGVPGGAMVRDGVEAYMYWRS